MTETIVDALTVVVALITLSIFGYAIFWAFNIRRLLVVRLYRNHALGVAIVAIGFALLDVENVLVNASVLIVPVLFLTAFSVFIIMFYWIDSAILEARRADPLLRDTARWRSLRKPLWVTIVITIAFAIGSSVAGYPGYGGVFIIPFILVGLSGGVVLPVAATRSKDTILNKHLRWFGIFFAFAIAGFIISLALGASLSQMNPTTLLSSPLSASTTLIFALIGLVFFSVAGYCLFRSVMSLIPLKLLPETAGQKKA